ncbi:uncharacterized protein FOBCDRAFT_195721 [Fusarium oxysporum Fo47]|nr:uncharacterized protein FOBCDRAFT_195721 [Fusarium oxysporum Fo47]QKD48230.1 hypothetical protein FOBCDRAFT_195721 [Fusarium oxysporum Fo47]
MYLPRWPKRKNRKPPDKLGFSAAKTATENHEQGRRERNLCEAYENAPPGAVVSGMTPEGLTTLPEPSSSYVSGFGLHNNVEEMYEKHRSYCLEKDEEGYTSKTKLGMLKVAVPENGHAIPFQIISAKHTNFQQQQLLQGVQFIFDSPESLGRFTDIINSTLFRPRFAPITPTVQIKLNIFNTKCLPQAPELMTWQEVGVGENPPASWALAYKHYDDRLKAVKKFCELPLVALVTLRFLYPYRNFDNLESLSKILRITSNLGLLGIEFEKDN